MEIDIATVTLARLYESQGYYRDALEQYTAVNRQNPSSDTAEAVQRMTGTLEMWDTQNKKQEAVCLAEQWMHLLLLKKRLKIAKACGVFPTT